MQPVAWVASEGPYRHVTNMESMCIGRDEDRSMPCQLQYHLAACHGLSKLQGQASSGMDDGSSIFNDECAPDFTTKASMLHVSQSISIILKFNSSRIFQHVISN